MTERVVWARCPAVGGRARPRENGSPTICAGRVRLCHAAGGEMEQIQFLVGHVLVQTTETYLGCKQRLRGAVNDRIGIKP